MPEARIGLLGCGRIARYFHLPLLQHRVVAAADLDETSRAAVRERVPAARLHADWRDLIDAGGLDAVVVCLPPALHAAAALAAFEAGLHVYVEKPLALTLAEAEAIETAWYASGRCGAVGFNFRFNPNFERLRARLADGELGRPVAIRGSFASPRRELAGWKTAAGTGGGALRDLCIHHLDLVAHLAAEPIVAASARERSVAAEGDVATVDATLGSGVPVQLVATQCTAHADNRIELLCEGGRLVAAANDAAGRPLERAPGRLERVTRARRTLGELSPRRLLHAPGAEPSFRLALEAFVDSVANGTPWRGADVADGRRVAALIDGIERAAGPESSSRDGEPAALAARA